MLVCFIALVILTITVWKHPVLSIDLTVYNWIVKYLMNDTMTSIMKFFTFCGEPKTIIGIIILLMIIYHHKIKSFVIGGYIGICYCIYHTLKAMIKRPRPDILRLIPITGFSFPSGHTSCSMITYGLIIILIQHSKLAKPYKITLSILLGLLIPMIGLSRIYLGVHYFTDVAAGLIYGSMMLVNFYFHLTHFKIIEN